MDIFAAFPVSLDIKQTSLFKNATSLYTGYTINSWRSIKGKSIGSFKKSRGLYHFLFKKHFHVGNNNNVIC